MIQGEIYLAKLEPVEGSEQGGTRPVVIISGNTMNEHFNVVICCPISKQIKNYNGCVVLKKSDLNRLSADSEVITFQVRSLSKNRLKKKLGTITPQELSVIHRGLQDVMMY